MRAFVAVEMSQPIREALGALILRFQRRGTGIKWVETHNIHLTLKFLGAVPDEKAPEVVEIARQCGEGLGPFRMELSGVDGFPDIRRPRVIFVPARDEPAHAHELARRLDEQMTLLDVPREERPFRCHVTLGRVRAPRLAPGLTEELAKAQEAPFGGMDVSEFVVMKSDLTAEGPVYTPVERIRLG